QNARTVIRPSTRHHATMPRPCRLPHHGRRLAAHQAGITKEGDGRSRQQGDATHQAHRLSSAARLPVPCPALRFAVSCARHSPTLPRFSPWSRSFPKVVAVRGWMRRMPGPGVAEGRLPLVALDEWPPRRLDALAADSDLLRAVAV